MKKLLTLNHNDAFWQKGFRLGTTFLNFLVCRFLFRYIFFCRNFFRLILWFSGS
jgi:hypothetical protein